MKAAEYKSMTESDEWVSEIGNRMLKLLCHLMK